MSFTAVLFSTMIGLSGSEQYPNTLSQEKIEFRGLNAMAQCRSFENSLHTKAPATQGIRKVSRDKVGVSEIQRETYCVQTEP
jgi:hypothetical protein